MDTHEHLSHLRNVPITSKIPLIHANLDTYSTTYIFHIPFTDAKREKVRLQKKEETGYHVKVVKTYMTDEEVQRYLTEYGDRGYNRLPSWLKDEMKGRNLPCSTRQPTELEQWETVADAREHRIVNKELIIADYQDKYIKGRPLTIT
jgi:hypothetical protein